MLVAWSKHFGKSDPTGKAVTNYMTADEVSKKIENGERITELRNPPPEILRGDVGLMQRCIRSLDFDRKYCSAVLSFHKDDVDVVKFNSGDEVLRAKVNDCIADFENTAFAGIDPANRPPTLWTTHTHTGRLELNFVTAKGILVGDKVRSINVNPPGKAGRALYDAFRDVQNLKNGWASPDDPARTRLVAVPDHVAKEQALLERVGSATVKDSRQIIADWAANRIAAGLITNRQELVAQLRDSGFDITREGADYVSVRDPSSTKSIRLKGAIFASTFATAATISCAANANESGSGTSANIGNVADPLAAAIGRLDELRSKREQFHKIRYQDAIDRYAATDPSDDGKNFGKFENFEGTQRSGKTKTKTILSPGHNIYGSHNRCINITLIGEDVKNGGYNGVYSKKGRGNGTAHVARPVASLADMPRLSGGLKLRDRKLSGTKHINLLRGDALPNLRNRQSANYGLHTLHAAGGFRRDDIKTRLKARLWSSLYGQLSPKIAEALKYVDVPNRSVRLTDGAVVTDRGDSITATKVTIDVAKLTIVTAIAKGWRGVKLTGSDEYKRLVAAEAIRAGLSVSNPELADFIIAEKEKNKIEREFENDGLGKSVTSDSDTDGDGGDQKRCPNNKALQRLGQQVGGVRPKLNRFDDSIHKNHKKLARWSQMMQNDTANELENFKRNIDLREVAAGFGFSVERKKSDRNHTVMVRGNDQISVGMSGDGHWCYSDHRGGQSGTVLDLVKRELNYNLGETRKFLRRGTCPPPDYQSPPCPIQSTESLTADQEQVSENVVKIWQNTPPAPGMTKYLLDHKIPKSVATSSRFNGTWKNSHDKHGNTVFPYGINGQIVGLEARNKGFAGYSKGASIGIWKSNQGATYDHALVITESPADAMAHYNVRNKYDETMYIAIRNGFSTNELVRKDFVNELKKYKQGCDSMRIPPIIRVATDSDQAGDNYYKSVCEIAKGLGIKVERDDPKAFAGRRFGNVKDWSDVNVAIQSELERLREELHSATDPFAIQDEIRQFVVSLGLDINIPERIDLDDMTEMGIDIPHDLANYDESKDAGIEDISKKLLAEMLQRIAQEAAWEKIAIAKRHAEGDARMAALWKQSVARDRAKAAGLSM